MVVVLEIQVFSDNSHSKGFPKFADVSSRPHKNKNFVVLITSFMLLSLVVDRESDKYHLILRGLFSDFKTPTY